MHPQEPLRQLDRLRHRRRFDDRKPADYFLNLMKEHKHVDWFMSAAEAKKHNIVNHLHVPEFEIKIGLEVNFG